MIQEATESSVVSLHHDISTLTGEEIVVFSLSKPSQFRERREISSPACPNRLRNL